MSNRYSRWIKAVLKKNWGRCPCCGRKPTGGIHHIVVRGCHDTKYIIENGIPTCYKLHRQFEDMRLHDKLIERYVGKEKYEKLIKVSNGYMTKEEAEFTEIK